MDIDYFIEKCKVSDQQEHVVLYMHAKNELRNLLYELTYHSSSIGLYLMNNWNRTERHDMFSHISVLSELIKTIWENIACMKVINSSYYRLTGTDVENNFLNSSDNIFSSCPAVPSI